MEIQNRMKLTAETESPANHVLYGGAETGIDLERNAATDDENRSVGNGEIYGGGRVGESAGVEMISMKRRRGRPRKYTVDRKQPAPVSPQRSISSSADSQVFSKRRPGRPRGRGRLQLLASLGGFAWDSAGGSFTPHVVHVAVGEDIVQRVSTFSSKGPRAICILSAIGTVSTVVLHQPGSKPPSILRYEGTFEILRLSGSFIGKMNRKHAKHGQITISLAKPDGRVFGGVVATSLIAASPIQIIVGSFKQKLSNAVKKLHTPGHSQPAGNGGEEICDAPSSPY